MKRSEINHSIKEAMMFFTSQQFYLPQWAYFSPAQWKECGTEYSEITNQHLGWSVSDFGKGNFSKEGWILFTLRNGSFQVQKYPKEYCEKVMMIKLGQNIPMHFHRTKMEDIINRGGGDLTIELWKSDETGEILTENLTIQMDGVTRSIAGGDMLTLTPGESLTLEPFVYHRFWAEKETSLVGIISKVNSNQDENKFLEPLGAKNKIEEDEPPIYLLCHEYPNT